MILLDTDIIIWILRGNIDIKKQFDELVKSTHGLIFITPIQTAEIMAGIREPEKQDTDLFLKSFNCISIDYKIGELAGQYMNKYRKSHNVVLADALIASTVYIHKLQIWTLNKKHYPMFDKEIFI